MQDSSHTPTNPAAVRIGDIIMIQDTPCKVVDLSHHKEGKHGSAKFTFTGIDVFNQRKRIMSTPASKMIYAPCVFQDEYQFVMIDDDDVISLLSKDMRERQEKVNDEALVKEIRAREADCAASGRTLMITIMDVCGSSIIHGLKEVEQG